MPDTPTAPSAPSWQLRTVQPTDALALHKDCRHNDSLDRVQTLLRQVQRNARQKRGLGLVVEQTDGRLIGFGQLTLWSRTAEISDLIVSEAWRSQGIGSAMITQLVESARTFNQNQVEIGVALGNTRALDLYHHLGFQDDRTLELNLGDGSEQVVYLSLDLDTTS